METNLYWDPREWLLALCTAGEPLELGDDHANRQLGFKSEGACYMIPLGVMSHGEGVPLGRYLGIRTKEDRALLAQRLNQDAFGIWMGAQSALPPKVTC